MNETYDTQDNNESTMTSTDLWGITYLKELDDETVSTHSLNPIEPQIKNP